jgi:hypothetical protein
MEFTKGNKLWTKRSKHGRDRIFATPEIMAEAADEYFQHIMDNPVDEIDFRGKDSNEVKLPHQLPFTLEGLTLFLHVNRKYFDDFEDSLDGKDDEISLDFSLLITRIRQIIHNQQYSMAAAGFLKENIVSRYLGLKDKADLTSDDKGLNMDLNVNVVHTGVMPAFSEEEIRKRDGLPD